MAYRGLKPVHVWVPGTLARVFDYLVLVAVKLLITINTNAACRVFECFVVVS